MRNAGQVPATLRDIAMNRASPSLGRNPLGLSPPTSGSGNSPLNALLAEGDRLLAETQALLDARAKFQAMYDDYYQYFAMGNGSIKAANAQSGNESYVMNRQRCDSLRGAYESLAEAVPRGEQMIGFGRSNAIDSPQIAEVEAMLPQIRNEIPRLQELIRKDCDNLSYRSPG
jgi:hypothetical protein